MYSYGPLHMAEQSQGDQQLCEDTGCVALRTCRKRWTIERGGELGSEIFMLMAGQNDDDDYYFINNILKLIFADPWNQNSSSIK